MHFNDIFVNKLKYFPTHNFPDVLQETFLRLDPNQRKRKIFEFITPDEIHPNKWVCRLCNEIVSRKDTAIDHFEGQHLQLLSYECPYCSKLFTTGSHQRVHIHKFHREENQRARSLKTHAFDI